MLIALQHLLSMIIPFEDVPSLRMLLGAVTTDPLIDILLAAGLTGSGFAGLGNAARRGSRTRYVPSSESQLLAIQRLADHTPA